MSASNKVAKLHSFFRGLDSAAVAFSGGVDSSVLAKTAYDALGDKAIAVTVISPLVDPKETANAKRVAKTIGITHILIRLDNLSLPCFRSNKPDRCYQCKKGILSAIKKEAARNKIKNIIDGTNAEDVFAHRPGYKAVREKKALTPLADLGFGKKDIRGMARFLRLPNADKPSNPCLATRIPYGKPITRQLLIKISKAESIVKSSGAKQARVRVYDDHAVIEVYPDDFAKIMRQKKKISSGLRRLGFKRTLLDLSGYSSGSMDKV